MKKTLLLSSLAVLAIACTKEPAAPIAGDKAVFDASYAEAPVVKTTLEGSKVLWAASDEISILWVGGSTTAQAASAGETTSFSATVGAADTYYAVYPSSVTAALSAGGLSLTVPAAQHGTFAEANIAVAKTTDRSLSFKNLCALGKFTLSRSDIASVRFSGNGEEAICGEASVAIDGSGVPSCSGATGKEIVLTPASGNAFAAGTYYFAVIPGTLSGGVTFTLTTSGGETLPAKTSDKSAALVRSGVLNFKTIDAAAPLELFFDFTVSGLGWPTSKSTSWATLKNCDSGCATDNDGTATDNPHRRAQVTYTLDGVGYDFTFADPDNATAHNIYLDPTTPNPKGVYSGTLRYFGLPAIEGKKLVKVVMVQNASTKTTAGWYRNVGITSKVYSASDAVADFEYVTGGEPQNQNTNGASYTYELSGTAVNTVYWLNSPTNASIIKSLRLFYADPDGSEPGQGDDPGDDPGPATLNLHFDFTGDPLEGWPTSDNWKTSAGNLTCVYPLDGTDYSFILTDCGNATAARVAWVKSKGGLVLYAAWRYLGLPAIAGYKLTKVSGNLCLANNANRKAGISKNVVESNATGTNEFVSGGEPIGWTTNGTTYAYNLTGTAANTVYYLTCTNTSIGTSVLDLVYEKVD